MVTAFMSLSPRFEKLLREKFAERLLRNRRYTLRAYARDLALSPSKVSEMLSGKQGISLKTARRVADKLRLSESEWVTLFGTSVKEDSA